MEGLSSNFYGQSVSEIPDVLCGCGLSLNNFDENQEKRCCPGQKAVENVIFEAPSVPSPFDIEKQFGVHLNSQLAVCVNNVSKCYRGPGGIKVLDKFSMKVPFGAIYSLLGSSGCGKTTILQCIVGLKRWDSGDIKVFGVPPCDDKEFIKIRQQIGYMPQDLALYDHLTVKEMLKYHGELYGMTEEGFVDRWKTLAKLLDLSSKRSIQIKDLSGGTKRRVSLALALLNRGQLILLDEPTVGLDPLLRKGIWEHLYELIRERQCTILLTTHYVEETRLSDRIGIMRNGKLLIEDSPEFLLATYRSNLLQDVILQICKKDQILSRQNNLNTDNLKSQSKEGALNEVQFRYNGRSNLKSTIDLPGEKSNRDKISFHGFRMTSTNEHFYDQNCILQQNITSPSTNFIHDAYKKKRKLLIDRARYHKVTDELRKSLRRTLSFSSVMWIYLLRQPIFAFILVFLPAVQLFMTFFVVGTVPKDLAVAVINQEAIDFSATHGFDVCKNVSILNANDECDLTFLSCHIQNYLSSSPKLKLIRKSNREQAEKMIQQGSLLGYLTFPANYSENLVNRFITGKFASDDDTLEGSKLSITLEKSHYLAYHLILKEVMDSLNNLSKNIEATCGFDNSYNDVPLHFRKPVYGKLNGSHQESIIPAIVAQILFEILYGIAPMILIKDWKQGTFIRSNLAGLQFSEFMLGIFFTMAPILLIQSISCYLVLECAFGFAVKGSIVLFVILCLLAGLCGQAFGIFMGTLLKSEFSVIVSAIMVVPIIMTCSGTLWPLEAHPNYLTIIYYIFPSALIVSSLRSVINRGVGITHALVWPGFVNTLSWSVAFWLLSIYGFRKMTRS